MSDPIHITWDAITETVVKVVGWLVAGIGGLAALLWSGRGGRIDAMEKRMEAHERDLHERLIEKIDEHAAESRRQLDALRQTVREDVRTIHDKIDRLIERGR